LPVLSFPQVPSARVAPVARRLELPFDPIDRAASIWTRHFGASSSMAAVTSIMRAQQILLSSLDALLRPYELTFARYEALVLLSFSRAGHLPMGMIGERLMVHPTSVTNIISRLATQGFVELRPNPADGRGKLAWITPAGRSVMEKATKDLMAAEFGLGEYSQAELAEMFSLLRGLRVAAGDFAAPPPAASAPVAPAPVAPAPAAPVASAPAAPAPAAPVASALAAGPSASDVGPAGL
jgi:DNA-binding MarR family transcriptional regulator